MTVLLWVATLLQLAAGQGGPVVGAAAVAQGWRVTACFFPSPSVPQAPDARASAAQERRQPLLFQSEDLRQIELEWERIWFVDQPSHLTPERVHGGIQ